MSATRHEDVAAVKAAPAKASAAAADATIQAQQDAQTATVGASAATILAAFIAWMAATKTLRRDWLIKQLARVGPEADIQAAVAAEQALEHAFAQASAERLARAMPAALSLPDPVEREQKVRSLLDAERRYSEQRNRAMMERAFAMMERLAVQRTSPTGAYWQLGVAHNHTAGCLVMGGHAWSWPVLNRVHPPRHPGCVSRLLSIEQAQKAGLVEKGWRPNLRVELARSAGVMMEEDREAIGRELELRDRMVELGVEPLALDAIDIEGVVLNGTR